MSQIFKIKYFGSKGGYVALLSILVVGAVGLSITVALLVFGSAATRSSFAGEQSSQAQSLSDSCIEEALQQIRDNTSFTGSATLSLNGGSCTYTVTNTGGSNRTVIASSTVGTIVRKTRVFVSSLSPSVGVSNTEELADF